MSDPRSGPGMMLPRSNSRGLARSNSRHVQTPSPSPSPELGLAAGRTEGAESPTSTSSSSIFATVITKPDEVSSSSQFSTVIQHGVSLGDTYSTVVHKAAESFRGIKEETKKPTLPRSEMRNRSASLLQENVPFEDPSLKYELLNELGKGSYGAVYKARDLVTSELVAVKVISLTEGEEGYEEIRGEIGMLQQCNHPNVVRYLGSFQGEDYLWIVMEYCGGGSVADLMNITDEALEEQQIAYICREALKGLTYLHSIFKVHRDIKGGNILLTEQGEVKLGDFGVAAQLTRTMSKRNTFIGTPHWMAPEVIQESRYDGKVRNTQIQKHVLPQSFIYFTTFTGLLKTKYGIRQLLSNGSKCGLTL